MEQSIFDLNLPELKIDNDSNDTFEEELNKILNEDNLETVYDYIEKNRFNILSATTQFKTNIIDKLELDDINFNSKEIENINDILEKVKTQAKLEIKIYGMIKDVLNKSYNKIICNPPYGDSLLNP